MQQVELLAVLGSYDEHGLRPSEGSEARGVGAQDRKAATGQFCETMSHTFAFGSCL